MQLPDGLGRRTVGRWLIEQETVPLDQPSDASVDVRQLAAEDTGPQLWRATTPSMSVNLGEGEIVIEVCHDLILQRHLAHDGGVCPRRR